MTQGRLLVLEGPDGVGKSSTVRGVGERLRALAIRHSVLAFPGREPGTLGKLIYDIHHDPESFGIEAMAEAAKQALHIAAHLDAIESRIGRLLNEGEHVLLDRFWWSIWVYGVVGGVSIDILEALVEAERVQWGSVQPSLIVLLDRDEPIERDGDINVWGRIRAEYLALASKERTRYPVEVVQNTGPAEQTASCVVDAEDQISTAVVGEHTHVAGEFGLAITVRKIKPHRPRLTIDALAGIGLLPGQLPLAKHWSAGRSLARQLRQAGAPPLRVISDGTLF